MYINIHIQYIVITCHALLKMFMKFRDLCEIQPLSMLTMSKLLAHLSRRLTGELNIVYSCSGVRLSVGHSQFQRSSPLKPLGQSKPNFMWSILRKGERKFI